MFSVCRKQPGFTLVEVVITIALLSIVAGFAITRFNDIKEQAYIDAMMNDLRNYAIVQEGYFNRSDTEGYGNPLLLKAEEDFVYSENVHTDHFFQGTGHWYLRVRHDKTDVKCELFFGRSTDITHTPNRILCPGNGEMGDVNTDVETSDSQFTVNAAEAEYTATASQANGAIMDFEVEVVEPDSTTTLLCRKNGAEEVNCSGEVPTDFSGEHTVTATASVAGATEGGLYDQAQTTYTVANTAPTADFTYTPSQPATQEAVAFDASASSDSDGWITNYLWDFGDGNTGSGETPEHTYSDDGSYPVMLEVVDNIGDTTQVQKTVEVANQPPQPTFDFTPNSPTTDDTVSFDATNTADPDGTVSSYSWDYNEDGTADDAGSTPAHSFLDDGTYAVELTVTDDDGATASFSDNVIVQNLPPTAQFSYSPDSLVASEPVNFDGTQSNDSDGSISSYNWTFGDGNSGSGATPSHAYPTSGTYTAELTVVDDDGSSHTTSQQLEVHNAEPTADFTYDPDSPSTADVVSLDANSSNDPDGSINSYEWDLNDDNTADSTGVTTDHQFPDDGSYPVSLTVTDDQGRSSTVEKTIDVSNQLPTASFSHSPTNPETLEDITFDGTGSSDPDGSVTAYSWDFGDGNTMTGDSATHSYADDGDYTVELTVTDNDSGTHSTTQTVSVTNQAPAAGFTWTPDNPRPDSTITFDGSGSLDSDGSISSYEWDFNEDGTADATGDSASHSFSSKGDHPVTLTVIDDDGASAQATDTVSVANSSPTISGLSCDDPAVTFETITCSVSASDPDGDPLSYSWSSDFSGTSSSSSESFGDDGTYTATVTVSDGAGGSTSDSTDVVVNNQSPTADFTFSPSSPNVNEQISFDGTGSSDTDGSVNTFNWDFNNDGVSDATGSTPTHTYTTTGNKTVVLTVVDDDGASGTMDTTFTVSNSAPSVSVSCDDPALTSNDITCTASASDPDGDDSNLSYSWSGDFSGTTATSTENFSDDGSYTATVTVTDPYGASDQASTSVTVNNRPPNAFFSESCTDLTCDFSDGSTDSDGFISSHSWDFGDGATSTATNPSHTYSAGGSYTVTLTVTDDDGATDTDSTSVSVTDPNDPPVADFVFSPSTPTAGETVSFDGTEDTYSFDPDGTITSFSWDFGDGGTGSNETTSHSFSSSGTYSVQLTVTDDDGATDDTIQSITVEEDLSSWSCSVTGTGVSGTSSCGASSCSQRLMSVSASTSDPAALSFTVNLTDYGPGVENTNDGNCSGRQGGDHSHSVFVTGTGEGWSRTSAHHNEEQTYQWAGDQCEWDPSSVGQIASQPSASGAGNGDGVLLFTDTGNNSGGADMTVDVPSPSGSGSWSTSYDISSDVDSEADTTVTFSCSE